MVVVCTVCTCGRHHPHIVFCAKKFSMISLPLKERVCVFGFSLERKSLKVDRTKLYIGEVVLGTAFGIVMGPHCAGLFDPRSWGSSVEVQNKITLEVMRVVLATGLFAIGVELPKAYLAEHVRSLLVMVCSFCTRFYSC